MKTANQKRQELLLIIVMLTVTLSSMSILLFNFILPLIQQEFGLSHSQVSWVTTGYTLLYGIGTAIYGKLADRYQLRNLLIFGLLVFSGASIIGFFSTSYGILIVTRCLQAIGAAAIPATSTLIPIRYYPEEQRGKAIGTVFAGLSLGNALAPITSSIVVSLVDWRWLFAIPLLLLFTLPAYYKFLGKEETNETTIDWLGGFLLAITAAQILLATTVQINWIIGGIIAALLFIWRIRTAKNPFVQPKLFQNREYTFYLILAIFAVGLNYALFFTAPLFLSEVYSLEAKLIGFVMVPASIITALLNRQGGKLADHKGSVFLFVIASTLILISYSLLSTLMGSNLVLIACLMVIGSVGQSFLSVAMSRSVSFTLQKEQAGVGMGLLMMQNFVAGSIAIGIYSRVIDIKTHSFWNPLAFSKVGAIYSNLFFVLSIVVVVIFFVFLFNARKKTRQLTITGDKLN